MIRRTPPLFASLAAVCAFTVSSFAAAPPADMPEKPEAKPAPAARAGAKAGAKPAAAKAAADSAPSTEDIKKSMDDGNYREALQKLSKALAVKKDAAGQYDRHELLRMKAEAHLNLKDSAAAASAFAAAAKEAPDDASRAGDKASELVVKRSKNLTFTPKPGKKGEKAAPIEILDPEKRKDAFKAMFEEDKAEAAPTLKAAQGAKTLPPIVEALKRIGDLRMLELAATGDSAESSKLSEDLAGQAHKLMDKGVQDMADLVKAIETSANNVQPVAVPARGVGGSGPLMYQSYKKKGLMTRDSQDLKRIISDLQKLVPMARDLAQSLGDAGKDFTKVADDGETVGNEANKVLHTDYGGDPAMRTQGLQIPTQRPRR
jgi:tetratricopeptide (TPR) repeat protein